MAKVIQRSEGGPTHEEIARRAYELFLQRGSAPGSESADWLQAEAELVAAAAPDAEATAASPRAPGATAPDDDDAGPGRANGRRSSGRERGGARRSIRP